MEQAGNIKGQVIKTAGDVFGKIVDGVFGGSSDGKT